MFQYWCSCCASSCLKKSRLEYDPLCLLYYIHLLCLRWSEDHLWELGLSFHLGSPRGSPGNQTQVVGLSGKCLRHLTTLVSFLSLFSPTYSSFCSEMASIYNSHVPQASLPSQPPECWHYRCDHNRQLKNELKWPLLPWTPAGPSSFQSLAWPN